MLIQKLKEVLQDQTHIFQDTYFSSSQTHELIIMYHFEHKNQDILQIVFISRFLQTLFAWT